MSNIYISTHIYNIHIENPKVLLYLNTLKFTQNNKYITLKDEIKPKKFIFLRVLTLHSKNEIKKKLLQIISYIT